jgi:predicted amidohydrolase YtcJ
VAADAELVFVGGGVWTLDPARPWATAVAVSGGRVALVGSDLQARELSGPHTQVIDLQGRMLLPGFQDAHSHPLLGGTERLHCDLSGGRRSASTAS